MKNSHLEHLAEPPRHPLGSPLTVAGLAAVEGYPDQHHYAVELASAINPTSTIPLHVQLERLQALAGTANRLDPDNVTGEELAAHYAILSALLARFAHRAEICARKGEHQAAEVYAKSAFKAHAATLAALSAATVVRDRQAQRQK